MKDLNIPIHRQESATTTSNSSFLLMISVSRAKSLMTSLNSVMILGSEIHSWKCSTKLSQVYQHSQSSLILSSIFHMRWGSKAHDWPLDFFLCEH